MATAYLYRNRLQPWEFLKAYATAAWKIIRRQEADREVFLVVRALNGPEVDRFIAEARTDPEAAPVLASRQPLLPILGDWDRLRRLPEDTLGRRLVRFLESQGVSNVKFAEASKDAMKGGFYSSEEEFLSHRIRDLHDVWHVVAGYSCDRVSENAMLAFTYGQVRVRGFGIFAAIGLFVRLLKNALLLERPDSVRMVWEAYRRGQQSARMIFADWPRLIAEPLDKVRQELNIPPPSRAWRPFRFKESVVHPALA